MKNKTILIGIAGASASGKTLLANTIVEEMGTNQVVVIPEDAYYNDQKHIPYEDRLKTNYDHPDAFDHELLLSHLHDLQAGKCVDMPIYDHTQHVRSEQTQRIGQHTIIVLEGIMLLAEPSIREMLDIKLFMDTPLDICLLRRIQRDIVERNRVIDSVIEQYQKTVRPMYLQFIEPSKRYADLVVPGGGENRIAIDLIKCKMKDMLAQVE